MSNNRKKITAPVTVSDVSTVLGLTSNDLNTLVKEGQINLLSRHKPIKQKDDSRLTLAADDVKRLTWWAGENGDYGVKTVWYSLADAELAVMMSLQIEYDRPAGGIYPVRLDDFDGYCNEANYIGTSNGKLFQVSFGTDNPVVGGTVYMTLNIGLCSDDSLLSFYDTFGITADAAYLGALIFILHNEGESVKSRYITTKAPIGQTVQGTRVTITDDNGNNICTYTRATETVLSMELALPSDLYKPYVGDEILLLPIISTEPLAWTPNFAANVTSIICQGSDIPESVRFGEYASFTLQAASADTNYHRPVASVTLVEAAWTISNGSFVFSFTAANVSLSNHGTANRSDCTFYNVTAMQIVVFQNGSYVYDASTALDVPIKLPASAFSTSSMAITPVSITVPKGYLDTVGKGTVVEVMLTIECTYNGDVFYAAASKSF